MRSVTKIIAALALAGIATTLTQATVVVGPTSNADALANNILGPGITLVGGSATLVGGAASAGTFTGGASAGIGIANGILLSTGNAADAAGPNKSDRTTGLASGIGDANLNGLLGAGSTTDTTSLEFRFTSGGGDLFFNYVFASEEYNEYSNDIFNDVFGFFLDGVNIALIPGTSTPVSINTVNGGNPLGVGAVNPQFYNNNDLNDGGPFFDIEYDGFTKVFTASALGLAPGEHTIKLAIGDVRDDQWDSAVFIQAGSFSDTPQPPGIPDGGSTVVLFAGGVLSLLGLRRKVG